jgi:hypothetical protein
MLSAVLRSHSSRRFGMLSETSLHNIGRTSEICLTYFRKCVWDILSHVFDMVLEIFDFHSSTEIFTFPSIFLYTSMEAIPSISCRVVYMVSKDFVSSLQNDWRFCFFGGLSTTLLKLRVKYFRTDVGWPMSFGRFSEIGRRRLAHE